MQILSTKYVGEWRNFSDIITELPCLYKEQYVRFGMREFGISERTAKKRLDNAIKEKDSKFYTVPDRNDRRRHRIFVRGSRPQQTSSISVPMALNEVALGILENCLKYKTNWQDRLVDYSKSREHIQSAMIQLEECVAESKGRSKYTKERNTLQKTWSKVREAIKSDPDNDKMQPLLDRGFNSSTWVDPHGLIHMPQEKED